LGSAESARNPVLKYRQWWLASKDRGPGNQAIGPRDFLRTGCCSAQGNGTRLHPGNGADPALADQDRAWVAGGSARSGLPPRPNTATGRAAPGVNGLPVCILSSLVLNRTAPPRTRRGGRRSEGTVPDDWAAPAERMTPQGTRRPEDKQRVAAWPGGWLPCRQGTARADGRRRSTSG
jgi:hypothetical protein